VQTSQVATHFWHFHSQSASHRRVYIASAPQYVYPPQYIELITVLDYS